MKHWTEFRPDDREEPQSEPGENIDKGKLAAWVEEEIASCDVARTPDDRSIQWELNRLMERIETGIFDAESVENIDYWQNQCAILTEDNERLRAEVEALKAQHVQTVAMAGKGYEKLRDQLAEAVECLKFIANGNTNFPTWEDTIDILKDVRMLASEALSHIKTI